MSSSTGDMSKKIKWFQSLSAKLNNESRRRFAEDKERAKKEAKPAKKENK